MLVGVPKEIKSAEYRVGLTPTAVRDYVAHGHAGIVETGACGGLPRGRVGGIGGGWVGPEGGGTASGIGASVTVLDKSVPRLRVLDEMFSGRVATRYSTRAAIGEEIATADAIIGAVLVPG